MELDHRPHHREAEATAAARVVPGPVTASFALAVGETASITSLPGMAVARCMRKNDVPDFHDPEPDGVIAGGSGRAMVGGGGAGFDRNDPRVRDAMQTSSQALPGITVR